MELRTVNTFLHIAELHSFSRTARQLGYSQSAVSSQIAQLEAELGTPLFDRVGKTVRLTDAGQTFLGYARTLLETAQQAQAALQPAQQVRGSLRIALADSVCSTFLPGLLQRYHARCPQVELVLHTASSDEMLQLLSTNQVDLVYTLDQPLLQPALVLAADVPEPVCFIAPLQHPLAQESVLPLDILPRQEFLLTERGMSYRDALDQCMAAHGLAIHPYLELGSAALLCQMVEQGMGLSFLPEYIVRSALVYGLITKAMLSHRYTFKAPLTSMELSVLAIIGIGFVLLIAGALLFISVRYTSKNVVDIDSTRNKGKVCPYCQTRIIGDAKHCPNCGQELGQ